MERYDLLVVGGVAAGTKAAAKARRERLDWSIAIVSEDDDISYAGCGLPYYIGGVIKTRRQLVIRLPEELELFNGIDVLIRHRAEKIDPEGHTVLVRDLQTGSERELGYGRLFLATGATPIRPDLHGIGLDGIHTLRTPTDGHGVHERVRTSAVEEVVVVGGGFIGVEVAENLWTAGVGVTLVEMLERILPPFDPEVSLVAQNALTEKGIRVMTSTRVEGFGGVDGEVVRVDTSRGPLETDMVLLSIGVRPNSALFSEAGGRLGAKGAIEVDAGGRTSLPDVFAAGDCATTTDLVSGSPAWVPMGSTANKQARASAVCATGGEDRFPGVLGTTIVKVFDISLGRTGLSEKEARALGYDVATALVPANDRAHYYPGSRKIYIKLVASLEDGRILGAQIYGPGTVDKPMDAMVCAITLGAVAEDLIKMDFCYAPPFSTAINPLNLAATVLVNKMDGRMDGILPHAFHSLARDRSWDGLLLDCREEPEHVVGTIEGALNIPLRELEDRKGELEGYRDRTIVVLCSVGRRAYEASLRLRSMGFFDVRVLEGGTDAWPYGLV